MLPDERVAIRDEYAPTTHLRSIGDVESALRILPDAKESTQRGRKGRQRIAWPQRLPTAAVAVIAGVAVIPGFAAVIAVVTAVAGVSPRARR
jgi:hypothetical protein